MQQIDSQCLTRAIIAAVWVIAGSICYSAGYFLRAFIAVGIAEHNTNMPPMRADEAFFQSLRIGSELITVGAAFLLLGMCLSLWALATRQRPID